MQQDFTVSPLGDGALLITFGNAIDEGINKKVLHFFHRIKTFSPFVTDVVPAYGSLAVYYDVLSLRTKEKSAFDRMNEALLPLLKEAQSDKSIFEKTITVPVCYAKKHALDLEDLAAQKAMTTDNVIQLHTEKNYRVYMIGFLPGFAYMGKVNKRIASARRSVPRTTVPTGSVGIAGEQTGIYPFASPGGWNIIGRTPLKLFEPNRNEPVLLQPGDNVRFYSITEDEFEDYQSRTA